MSSMSNHDVPGDLIKVGAAAALADVSRQTMHRWVRTGRLRGWWTGLGRVSVSKAEVLALIRPVPVEPTEPVRTARQEARAAEAARQRLASQGYGFRAS